MATLGATHLTLADHAKRFDPDGKIADIVDTLTQNNPILMDLPYVEGNLPTGHRSTIRMGLFCVSVLTMSAILPSGSKRLA